LAKLDLKNIKLAENKDCCCQNLLFLQVLFTLVTEHYVLRNGDLCIMLSHVQRDEEDDVYEEVDEDEYSDIVRRRQEDNWIVDDGNVLRCEIYIIMVSCYNFHDSQK